MFGYSFCKLFFLSSGLAVVNLHGVNQLENSSPTDIFQLRGCFGGWVGRIVKVGIYQFGFQTERMSEYNRTTGLIHNLF